MADRLRRLLVMLPWLMERVDVPVAEMAARFEVSEHDLVRDLELAAMCGLPPFVDEMIDVFIDEGIVHAGVPRLFTRPLRLTAPEGFALLIAGRASLQLPGADPSGALARALDRLATVLGDDGVTLDAPQPPATADVIDAASRSARLAVRYWSAHSDELSQREITPRTVFVDRGHWYVIADDHRSGAQRTFRIDRLVEWAPTGVVDEPRAVTAPGQDDWFGDEDLPQVTLRLAPAARWVAERYPVSALRDVGGGSVEVTLAVTGEAWLRTLLLRLGPRADVLGPPEWRGLGATAAAELLARYEATGS